MVQVVEARSDEDFSSAAELIGAMADWDARETEAAGFPGGEMLEAYYVNVIANLCSTFAPEKGGLLLARSEGNAAGFVAYLCSGEIGRIDKLFVSPEHRGKGVARALVGTMLERLSSRGARTVRLTTATFMKDAQALYRSFGFAECPPFEVRSKALLDVTVFMQRDGGFD
jgi:ribosomal protein S18 acetylase RimI-like enzyme